MMYVLYDLTTSATPLAMRPGPSFPAMIEAWLEQFNGPYATAFGAFDENIAFRIGREPADRQTNERAIHFRDAIPEAPDALAYHYVVDGVPDIEIGVDLFDSLTGPDGVACGASHELLETDYDPGANAWSDQGAGYIEAREACDRVQNLHYESKNGVYVSDFLLPAFWIPGAPGPLDMMGKLKSRDDSSLGYAMIASAPSDVSQVGGIRAARKSVTLVGDLSLIQAQRKVRGFSRTRRRGAHDAARMFLIG